MRRTASPPRAPSLARRGRGGPNAPPSRRRPARCRGRGRARDPCPRCPARRPTSRPARALAAGSLPAATASAQAADVLMYSGKRRPHAALEEVHQRSQVALGGRPPAGLVGPERADTRHRDGEAASTPPADGAAPRKGDPGRPPSARAGAPTPAGEPPDRASSRSRSARRRLAVRRPCRRAPADHRHIDAGTRARPDRPRSARRPPARPARSVSSSSDDVGQLPRRQGATRQLSLEARCLAGAGELGLQHTVGDLPTLKPVELDGDRVVEVPGLVAQRDAEPLAQERAHRVAQEPLDLIETDGRRAVGLERVSQERRRAVSRASAPPARRPGGARRSSTARRRRARPARSCDGSKGWSGCATTTASRARPSAVRTV